MITKILPRILLFTALFILFFDMSFAQDLFQKSYRDNSYLNDKVENAQILKLNKEYFDRIFEEKPYNLILTIPVEDGIYAKLNIERFNVLTPNAYGIEKSPNGDRQFDPNNLVVAYKGTVDGINSSIVSLNFSINGVNGLMMGPNERYVISKQYNTGDDQYVLYRESKLKIGSDFVCETSDDISPELQSIMSGLDGDVIVSNDIREATIALDLDFATFNQFGSVNNATAYALSLLATSSAIYLREMNVRLTVPFINVWSSPDPYTGSNSNQILTQFRSYWNNNHQGVQRSLAHLISTRSGGLGGIAYLNVLCASLTSGSGYGFSNTDGIFGQLPTYSWDVDVFCHELGHNFGSPHTHNCSWPGGPIDSCYAVEGGCYSGPAIPIKGTIMSYCHLTSMGKILYFGDLPRQLIRTRAENAPCLTNSSLQILLAYPNGGEVFRTFNNMNIIWGTGFSGNINIEFSSNNGVSWTSIASNIPSNQNEYIWAIPNLDSTNQARIRIFNSANSSQGDTCDQVFTIHKNLTMLGLALNSPPNFTRINTGANDTTNYKFDWRKAGFHPSIRYKWAIQKVGSGGYRYFESNNGGVDTSITIQGRFLDSLANVFGYTGDSVWCTWKVWAYNGYDSSGSNTFIVTIANPNVGINNISQEIPSEFKLFNNYPNPFNPTTRIRFDVPEQSYVNLKVYDYLGREITQLVNEDLTAGSYEVDFNTSELGNLPSGVYFYKIQTNGKSGAFVDTKRMILIK